MNRNASLFCAAMAASLGNLAHAQFAPDSDIVVSQPVTVSSPVSIRSITVNDVMTIANGGAVAVTTNVSNYIGLGATGGVIVQNGGTFTLTQAQGLIVGCDGGTGTLTVAPGGLVDLGPKRLCVANNSSGNNRDPGTRGTLDVSGTVIAGGLELTGNFPNQGEPRVEAGIVNLWAGGLLQVNSIMKNDRATSYINFNGGTLRLAQNTLRATTIGNSCELHLVAASGSQAIFDIPCDYVVINDTSDPQSVFSFSGSGTLVKRGTGSLAFRMNPDRNVFAGPIVVEAGALDLGRPLAQGQAVTVWAGASFLAHPGDDPLAITYLAQRAALYTVANNVTNLDLIALTAFYDDAVGTPLVPGDVRRLVGPVTHNATAGTPQHPFRLVAQGGSLDLEGTGLEDEHVLLDAQAVPGTFDFQGARTLTPATTNRIAFLGAATYGQTGALTLNGAALNPLDWRISAPAALRTWGVFTIGERGDASLTTDSLLHSQEVRIGFSPDLEPSSGAYTQTGGTTTFHGLCTVGGGNGHGSLHLENATLIINNDLRLAWGTGPGADDSYRPYRPSASVTLGPQSRLQCNTMLFTPMWPSSWATPDLVSTTGVADVTLRAGSLLDINRFAKNDCTVSTVFFDGGTVAARQTTGGFIECNWVNASLNFEATAGNAISIDTRGHHIYITRQTGAVRLTGPGGLRKRGSGDLGLGAQSSDYRGDTLVEDGTLILTSPNVIPSGPGFGGLNLANMGSTLALGGHPQNLNTLTGRGTVRNDLFRFFRLKLEGPRAPATATSVQLAAIELYSGNDNITGQRTRTDHDTGGGGPGGNPNSNAYPAGEEPYRIVDGDWANTKWNDFRAAPLNNRRGEIDRAWLRIEFDTPRKLTAYRWVTANDAPERDPAAWRIQGSMDASTWFDLDARAGYSAPAERGAPTEMFAISPAAITPRNALGILADGADGEISPAAAPTLQPEVPLRKLGGGELTLSGNGIISSPVTVEAGALRLAPAPAYRFLRFKIENNRNITTNDGRSTQLSEFELYNGPENVTPLRTAIHYDPTGGWGGNLDVNAGPEHERADFAVDGNTATKWNDFRISRPADRDRVWLAIEFPAPQPVTAYRYITANDAPDRDPSAWRIQGSDNGQDWTDIATVSNYQAPRERFTPTPMFPLAAFGNAYAPLTPQASLTLRDATALTVDGLAQALGGLSGTGSVTLDNGATLGLTPPDGDAPAFFGPISGDGSLLKQGPGTQHLLGPNTFTGPLTVQDGTLATGTATPYTWFRFTVKRKASDTGSIQISELALHSADNARRNLGLRFAPAMRTAALAPGECSTPNGQYPNWSFEGANLLFDGNTGTKFCTTATTPAPGNPSSWYVILMRLPDGTPEITHYNFATANDSSQYTDRNPVDWTLEASPDGLTWFTVDERSGVTPPGANYTWYNSGLLYAFNAGRAAPAPSADSIPDTAVVTIADGATLITANPAERIGALGMNLTAGAGTLTRLNPTPNGTLYLTGVAGSPQGLLPLTVQAMSNTANLATWQVHVNGTLRPGLRISYDPAAAKLRLSKGGTILMIK